MGKSNFDLEHTVREACAGKEVESVLQDLVVEDFNVYAEVKGEEWLRNLNRNYKTNAGQFYSTIEEFVEVWAMKWRERSERVDEKTFMKQSPDREDEVALSIQDREEMVRYIKELLVLRNEVARMDAVADAVLSTTLRGLKTGLSGLQLKLYLANRIHFTMAEMLRPANKIIVYRTRQRENITSGGEW